MNERERELTWGFLKRNRFFSAETNGKKTRSERGNISSSHIINTERSLRFRCERV